MSLKTLFFPLAIIITVFLVVWFIIPQWEDVQKKKSEFKKKEDVSISLNQKITKINEEIAVYENNSRDASVIYQALPSDVDNDVLVDEIFNGAKKNGVLITKIDVSKAESIKKNTNNVKKVATGLDQAELDEELLTKEPETYKVSFKLELAGGYIETKNFINFVETATRLFTVDNFEIKQANEESNALSTSVSISCFYKKDDPSLKIASVIYNSGDRILKELADQEKGLDVDFILQHKNNIENSGYVFNPAVVTAGKIDLFSKGAAGNVVATE